MFQSKRPHPKRALRSTRNINPLKTTISRSKFTAIPDPRPNQNNHGENNYQPSDNPNEQARLQSAAPTSTLPKSTRQQRVLSNVLRVRRKDGTLKHQTDPNHPEFDHSVVRMNKQPDQRHNNNNNNNYNNDILPYDYNSNRSRPNRALASIPTRESIQAQQELRLPDPDQLYTASTIPKSYPNVDWFAGIGINPTIHYPLNHHTTTDKYLHQSLPQFTARVGSETQSDIVLGKNVRDYVTSNGCQVSYVVGIGQHNERIAPRHTQAKTPLLPEDHPFNNLANVEKQFTPLGNVSSQSWGLIALEDIPKGSMVIKLPSRLAIRDGTPVRIRNSQNLPKKDKVWLQDLMTVMTFAKVAIAHIPDPAQTSDTMSFGLHLALLRIMGDFTDQEPIIKAFPADFPQLDLILSKDSMYRSAHRETASSLDFFEKYCNFILSSPIHGLISKHKWILEAKPSLLQYFDPEVTIFDALFTLTKYNLDITTEEQMFRLLKWGLYAAQTRTVKGALPHPDLTGFSQELRMNPYRALLPFVEYMNHSDSPNCLHIVQYYPPVDGEDAKEVSKVHEREIKAAMAAPIQEGLDHGIAGLMYRPIFATSLSTSQSAAPGNSQSQAFPFSQSTTLTNERSETMRHSDPVYSPININESMRRQAKLEKSKASAARRADAKRATLEREDKKKNTGKTVIPDSEKEDDVSFAARGGTDTPFDRPKTTHRDNQLRNYESNHDNFNNIHEVVITLKDIKAGEELTLSYYPLLDFKMGDVTEHDIVTYRKTYMGNLSADTKKAFKDSLFRNPGVRGESRAGTFSDVKDGKVIPFQHGFVPNFNPNHSIFLNKFPQALALEYTPSYFYLNRGLTKSYFPGNQRMNKQFLSEIDDPNFAHLLRESPHAHYTRADAPFPFMVPAQYPSLDFHPRNVIEENPRYSEVMKRMGASRILNPRNKKWEPLHNFLSISWRGPTPLLEAMARLYAVPMYSAPNIEENSTLSYEQSGEHIIQHFHTRTNMVLDQVEANVREIRRIHSRQELSHNDWLFGFSQKIDEENEAAKNFVIFLQLQQFLLQNPFPLRHVQRGYLNSLYAKDYDSAMFGLDLYHDTTLAVHASRVLETVLGFDSVQKNKFMIGAPWKLAVQHRVSKEDDGKVSNAPPSAHPTIDIERLLHRTALPYQSKSLSHLDPHNKALFERFYLGGSDIAPTVNELVDLGVIRPKRATDDPENAPQKQLSHHELWANEFRSSVAPYGSASLSQQQLNAQKYTNPTEIRANERSMRDFKVVPKLDLRTVGAIAKHSPSTAFHLHSQGHLQFAQAHLPESIQPRRSTENYGMEMDGWDKPRFSSEAPFGGDGRYHASNNNNIPRDPRFRNLPPDQEMLRQLEEPVQLRLPARQGYSDTPMKQFQYLQNQPSLQKPIPSTSYRRPDGNVPDGREDPDDSYYQHQHHDDVPRPDGAKLQELLRNRKRAQNLPPAQQHVREDIFQSHESRKMDRHSIAHRDDRSLRLHRAQAVANDVKLQTIREHTAPIFEDNRGNNNNNYGDEDGDYRQIPKDPITSMWKRAVGLKDRLHTMYQEDMQEREERRTQHGPSPEELEEMDLDWQRRLNEREKIQTLQDMHVITSQNDPFENVRSYRGLDAISKDGMAARGSMKPYDKGEDSEFERQGPYGPVGPNGHYADEEGPYKRE